MSEWVLASSSPYRREMLERLGRPFRCVSPEVDESARADEGPAALVARLAEDKARAVAEGLDGGLVIGSDQLCERDGEVLGKPGNHEAAVAQLCRASGRTVTFHTGLALVNAATGTAQVEVVETRVRFRELDDARIERYLRAEQPYDCAGGFKSEGLGVVLFEAVEGDDPAALIGLPLIRLVAMLEAEGETLP
ncbi:MAG: Maf family protein [Pseudomonadota bacterium]